MLPSFRFDLPFEAYAALPLIGPAPSKHARTKRTFKNGRLVSIFTDNAKASVRANCGTTIHRSTPA